MQNSDVRVLLLNPAPSLIKYGVKYGLEANGCYVYLFDYGETKIFDKTREEQLQKIEQKIIEDKINLIFCEGYYNFPIGGVRKLCDKYNIQLHLWCIEDPVTLWIGETFEKFADFLWATTIEFIKTPKKIKHDEIKHYFNNCIENGTYRHFNTPCDLLLFGCNKELNYDKNEYQQYKHDINIVGTNYSNRFDKTREFILPLIENEFDVFFTGYWWMNPQAEVNLIKYPHLWRDNIDYLELPKIINSSKIMVGLNCSDKSITQTSCRPYETLAFSEKAIYLAYHTKAQELIFGENGQYIYQAKTGKEMIELANMILDMPTQDRIDLAKRAREFVVQNHDYSLRCKKIIEQFRRLKNVR